ncbi:ankyrin repeat domain-containing protein [Treponema vincentii]|uniref:ankyrin repeat domain-containing protein n=1 Tax=Treponema vincentii TaxID=69710 RepID=UPI0020A35A7B|nr:ankyrin repeat domain-containing protein [Treponema vincentii]UTC59048.1 ankyrin repeat domain-containing protein [Treponema vincentii]
MKIVILYEKTEKKISEAAAHIIESHECDVVYRQADTIWEDSTCPPTSLLQDASHILFVFAKNTSTLNSAFIFFLGLGIGRNLPILTLGQGTVLPLPKNCMQFAVPLALDIFEEYFIKEQQNFLMVERKRLAREKLLNSGFPCFESNFAAAVQEGKYEIVRLFLEAGFDASQRDTRGTPLLSLAVRNSQYDIASLLLTHGAEINLCSEDRSYSALMEAAQLGDLKTAQLLLSKDADTDIQSKDGQTALILAVGRQDVPMVKLLIEHHADYNIADVLGMSALGYAKLFHNKDILEAMQQP